MASELDKSALLKQLTIDKNQPPPAGISVLFLIISVIVTALLAGSLVYFFFSSSGSRPPPPILASAETSPTTASSHRAGASAILNASGYITARRIATVSSEIMGRITHVDVEEGMRVEEGWVLAGLDDTSAKVELKLAQAQVQAQQERIQSNITDLEEAKRVLQRFTRLGEGNFSSEAQRTRAQADVAKLSAALASARADRRVAELNVERQREHFNDHTIRAPFSGIITVKNAQPGEIVAPAAAGGGYTRTGICTLVDMDSLEIEVDVNEAYIGRVYEGQKVVANLDAYADWDIPASVIAIIPTADRAKATVAVRIKIENKDLRILPNMGVKVAFFDNEQG